LLFFATLSFCVIIIPPGPKAASLFAIQAMDSNPTIREWCNEFLTGLATASRELATTYASDILSVYTTPGLATAEDLLNDPEIVDHVTNLSTQIYQIDSVGDAFFKAAKARPEGIPVAERKEYWAHCRKLFAAKLTELVTPIINSDGQCYWHPCSPEEQAKGAKYFLEQNMNLRLTFEQKNIMRAESLLYFMTRTIQLQEDPETDDKYALIPQEVQKKWTNSSIAN
jgi:hypothetical protein